ncbi:hypothetical protein Tco_0273859 [Tanacetum coccineum]
MSQEIVHIAVNSVDIINVNKSCVDECNKCLDLETELLKKKDLIENDVYDKLLKSYSTLEKHCISLELTTQLNQEIIQKDNFHENQNAPTFNQLFELNELKAQSQEKDTVIRKLKEKIKSLSGKDSVENVKKDIDEIETINFKLEHSVAKLLFENENLRKEREHLKLIYKDQFDSIRKTRVQSKEHCDSLIAQINAKSVENSDLNAQLQEKVFAIATLKKELRKLKGKNVVDTVVSKPSATIAPGMFKLDIEPISHRLKHNRYAHEVYLEKTIENIVTLRGLIKCARKQYPSEPLLESACMFTKHVQELLVYVSKTCPRVKPTTSASRSKPSGNTKNNRITRPPSSNQKNKVEEHPRKKCIVDVEVFRKILDICLRVEGKEFTPIQDDDDTPTFLTDLGYKEIPLATPVITLPPPTVSTIPPAPLQQTTTPIPSPPITTDAPTITTIVPTSDALSTVQLRVVKLEKDVSKLKKIDHSAKALATLKSQVPMVVEQYLRSKIGYDLQKIKKEQAEKQKMPKYTIKSTDKAALKELYHALMEALIEDENAKHKRVADTVKDHKRKHDDDNDDDEDLPAGLNQGKKTKRRRTKESESSKKPSTIKETPKGKAPSKGSKSSKSAFIKEPVDEPIAEVVMDDAGEDEVRDDDWYVFNYTYPLPIKTDIKD